jgi:hypothetical protein
MSLVFIEGLGKPIEFDYITGSKEVYGAILRPRKWSSNTVCVQNKTIFLPNIANGCGYICTQGGITDNIEPIWDTLKGSINISGTAKFKTIIDDFKLQEGETITLIDSTPNNMTIDNLQVDINGIGFRVLTATTGACLHLTVDITTLSGLIERQIIIFTFTIITPAC